MKERPIIFSGEMVRAILDGRKTMTRRVIKTKTPIQPDWIFAEKLGANKPKRFCFQTKDVILEEGKTRTEYFSCPYGKVGDRLKVELYAKERCPLCGYTNKDKKELLDHCYCNADDLTLEITNIRVERLQEITEADAKAEGCVCRSWESQLCDKKWDANQYATNVFSGLWDSINLKRGFGWELNPFVWVVEFKRI